VDVFRVKEFHFKPLHHHDNHEDESAEHSGDHHSDKQTLALATTKQKKAKRSVKSTWNVDGEAVEHPVVHVR